MTMTTLQDDCQNQDFNMHLDVKDRRRMRAVLTAFVSVALLAVALAMLSDSMELSAGSALSLAGAQEQSLPAKASAKTHAKTVLQMRPHINMLAENQTADDGNSTEAAPKEEEDEGDDTKEEADDTKEEADDTKEEGGSEKQEDDEEAQPVAPRPPYKSSGPDIIRPGWGPKKAWDTGDWAVFIICGPIFSVAATMFVFYTYGPLHALGTLAALIVVDVFAYYYNV